jgi:hypothetical protein
MTKGQKQMISMKQVVKWITFPVQNSAMDSFIPFTIRLWNTLPLNITESLNI